MGSGPLSLITLFCGSNFTFTFFTFYSELTLEKTDSFNFSSEKNGVQLQGVLLKLFSLYLLLQSTLLQK